MTYTFTTTRLEQSLNELDRMLEEQRLSMQQVRCRRSDGECAVKFTVEIPDERHLELVRGLRQLEGVREVGHEKVPE